jgi:hypothetical protein
MNKKLTEFIKRNKKRNAHLYQPGMTAGHDYVTCPISGQRLSMIKDNYITKILGMPVDQYPGVQRICDKRKENIKTGLKKIDPVTGLTKYEVSQVQARQILKQVDSDGLSGYKKKGQRTRATHMRRVDQFGRNGYRRQAHGRLTTILENGLTVEQNAHIKQKETLIKNNKTGSGGASKLSKKALAPIISLLKENKIKFYFDLEEYGIKDTTTGNYYFWDLTIPDYNIAIEYQSSAWHADPALPQSEWESWRPPKGLPRTAHEVLDYDYTKARSLYKHRGIVTYYVWQKTQEQNIEEILCLLKIQNTKY